MDEVAALIEPQIPGLRRYAWALVRDREAADDLVQDCLERALARWHLRRRDASLKAWLFAIQHNLFIDRTRRARRDRILVEGADVSGIPDPHVAPEGRLGVWDILICLDALPGDQKDVILLVGVEDLSYAETARVLGIPVGTVMSRLSRGRERLRNLLETNAVPALRRVK